MLFYVGGGGGRPGATQCNRAFARRAAGNRNSTIRRPSAYALARLFIYLFRAVRLLLLCRNVLLVCAMDSLLRLVLLSAARSARNIRSAADVTRIVRPR